MKKLGVLLAVFFALAFSMQVAHGAGEQKAQVIKEVATQQAVVAPTVSNGADAKEYVDGRLIDYYQNLTSHTLSFAGLVIAIFAALTAFVVIKGHQLNKEARKELDEIYKIKDSTRKHLDKAEESIKESEKQIGTLIETGRKELDSLRAEVKQIAADARNSAKEAKSSEDKSKAIEHFMEGYRLAELGQYEEAIAACDKAIQLDPTNADAYYNKGVAFDNLDRFEEAIVAYDKTIEIAPDYERAYNNKGYVLLKLGRYDEAITSLNKAIELNPKDAFAYSNKGYSLINLARYDDAIDYIKKALVIRPDFRGAKINMALALQKRGGPGDTDNAKAILMNLINENSQDDNAARAYALLGDRDDMLMLVRILIAKKPHLKLTFKSDLEFEAYRDDPEFKDLVEA